MAVEQPKYAVEVRDGRFELRRYAPLIVAEVQVDGDQGQAVQKGFRRLAGYIFGANDGGRKIAMTAPVSQAPTDSTSFLSPAPGRRWVVQFTMPSAYATKDLPRPSDPGVRFREEPARRIAALSFSGVARGRDYAEKAEALKAWLAARGFSSRATPVLAQYDPPWTPWFMRRNEVLIEVG